MKTVLILCLLVVLALSRTYPMYKQCDSRWGSHTIGTSTQTICQIGCCMTSAAMALAGTGHNFNPLTLNTWLINNGGYVNKNNFVWSSMTKLGLNWRGWVPNSRIKINLDVNNVVILNVHGGHHWVLATHYSGDTIYVNDPGFSTTAYTLSQIVDGHNAVFTPSSMPTWMSYWLQTAKEGVYNALGVEREIEAAAPTFLPADEQATVAEIKTA